MIVQTHELHLTKLLRVLIEWSEDQDVNQEGNTQDQFDSRVSA